MVQAGAGCGPHPAGSLDWTDWQIVEQNGRGSWSPPDHYINPPPQFRDNLQDLLPALPNADDYFLLRWLRGEAVSGGSGEAAGREETRVSGRLCQTVL